MLAAIGYTSNGHVMDGLPIGFTDYSRYVAPPIEELIKAVVVVGLFALGRIGFKLDAAIVGFTIGAGFALSENAYYLWLFPEANLGVWLVRGFGTAVMHGGATALFAVITHEFAEHRAHREGRISHLYPWVFLPGLAVAIVVHSAFNYFPGEPLLAMLIAFVVLPLTILLVFSKGGATAHDWLEHDHEAHAELLAEIRNGRFAETTTGAPSPPWPTGFRPGSPPTSGPGSSCSSPSSCAPRRCCLPRSGASTRRSAPPSGRIKRLDEIGREIGHAARHAIRPHLRFSREELYELNMLRHRAEAAHLGHAQHPPAPVPPEHAGRALESGARLPFCPCKA